MRRVLVAVVALACWLAQASLLHGMRQIAPPPDRLYVPRPELVRLFKTDFDNLVADGLWIAVLVHNGGQLQIEDERARNFQGMYEALDLVGQLDPRFSFATTLGSWFLADGGRTDEACRLLRRRMAEHPGSWEFPYHLGFVEFLYGHDHLAAAQHFQAASRLSGCPPSALRMAASLYARSNKRELAIATWQRIYLHGDPTTRGIARRALERLGVPLS